MKTFVATVFINVEHRHKMKKATSSMIKRFCREKIRVGAFDDVVFRERICLEIKEVKCDVLEVSK